MSTPNFFDFREQVAGRKSAPPGPPAEDALTVSQITARIESALRRNLPPIVLVKGEASNYKIHAASGHHYFTLKDEKCCIDCAMYRSEAVRLKFTPDDGMELLVTGRIGVYGARGKYQLYATAIHPVGQGALELAFKQLCAKLQREGLFAAEQKKPIPPYPTRIAMVTSQSTAALQDMLKVLRRFPWLALSLYHIPVQGDGAAAKIAAALQYLNETASPETGSGVVSNKRLPTPFNVILLARGGGSLEDLWPFNEETVARAVAASRIPVITGIGHEVDVSIADLVADHHAHTPTEAAQVATANWRTARDLIDAGTLRIRRSVATQLQQARQRLLGIERHDIFRRPMDRLNQLRQLLDDRQRALSLAAGDRLRFSHRRLAELAERLDAHRPAALFAQFREALASRAQQLTSAMATRLRGERWRLNDLAVAMIARHPRHRITLTSERLNGFEQRLQSQAMILLQRRRHCVEAMASHLNAVSPEQVLKRGYSLTTLKKTGAVVRSPGQVKEGDRIVTRLADGQIESTVEDSRQLPLFE